MGNWGYRRLRNFVLKSPQERQHRGVMSTWTGRHYRSPRNSRALGTDVQYQVYGPRLGNEGLHVLKDGLFFVVGSGISTGCFLQSENQSISTNVDWEMVFSPALFATGKRKKDVAATRASHGPVFHSSTSLAFWLKNKKTRGGKRRGRRRRERRGLGLVF